MNLFALKDSHDSSNATLAVLSCYGAERVYYIDMPEGTDPWTVPLILSSFAKRGKWTIGPEWSGRWVESRIVPQSRQNLGEVLRENGLDEYDSLRLIELTEGRNSQDDCYLQSIGASEAPDWFAAREALRVVEAVPLERGRLLIAFATGDMRILGSDDLMKLEPGLERVVGDPEAFAQCEAAPGGRGVMWGSVLGIDDADLFGCGESTGLSWEDISRIAADVLVSAHEAADMLGCTRQNLNALVKRRSVSPVKASGRSTLFLRADIRARCI